MPTFVPNFMEIHNITLYTHSKVFAVTVMLYFDNVYNTDMQNTNYRSNGLLTIDPAQK